MLLSLVALYIGLAIVTCFAEDHSGRPYETGNESNRRILLVTNSESGLGNVFLATSHVLATNHTDTDVHFASFAKFAEPVATVSRYAQKQSPNAKSIVFHTIPGNSYALTLIERGYTMDDAMSAPGLVGNSKFLRQIELYFMPWTAEEYIALQRHVAALIEDVDPAIIVMDSIFAPALDAARHSGRKVAMLSPNTLQDLFGLTQPWVAGFWKYPAMSSGYPYPVPWYLVPANIWMNLRLVYSVLKTPTLDAKKALIRAQGLEDPVTVLQSRDENAPWISPSLPELEYPLAIPPNVTVCGPIYVSTASLAEQDPELAAWLEQAPTILVNLGSTVTYSEAQAASMALALRTVLEHHQVQVIWKIKKRDDLTFSDDFLAPIAQHIKSDRVRVTPWLKADPAALLESGNIVLSVHHGGANCFFEAIGTGVPAIVLPLWVDLYDFAVRAEWLGVGIWGNAKTAPEWTPKELGDAFLQALGDSERAKSMRVKAKELAALSKERGGRKVAAQAIVDYMDGVYTGNIASTRSRSIHQEL